MAEHGKVQWAVFVTEATANGNAAVYDAPYRTLSEILRLERFEWGTVYVYGCAFFPQKTLAHDVGMQREQKQAHPPHGHPTTKQSIAKLAQYILRVASRTRAVNQPVNDRLGVAIFLPHGTPGGSRKIVGYVSLS